MISGLRSPFRSPARNEKLRMGKPAAKGIDIVSPTPRATKPEPFQENASY
jgi:hypothetical protein